MVKMSEHSRTFLRKYIPEALGCEAVNDVLDQIYEFIDLKGFAPPHYDSYNDLGREAQRVYDDVYLSNE